MRFRCGITVPLQVLCGGSSLILGLWIQMPAVDLALLGLLSLLSMSAVLVPRETVQKCALITACFCSVLRLAHALTDRSAGYALDNYFSIPPFLVAIEFLLASKAMPRTPLRQQWSTFGMVWALVGASIWLAAAYSQNLRLSFHIGLVLLIGLLILLKRMIALSWIWIQLVNTVLLLAIALPGADWILRPTFRVDARPDPNKKVYLYDNAMRDPGAYAAWRQYALTESVRSMERYYVPDPNGVLPFRLRPNAHGQFFRSTLDINSRGFRGAEFPLDKGDAYRIVALGESTTFGYTYAPGDEPWPVLLERIIRDRLKPARPVEVINAGVPGYTIQTNLRRLQSDILPLKPDMILSYHGINGFPLILPAIPPSLVKNAPIYRERPLMLLAAFEFKVKILLFKHRQSAGLNHSSNALPDPMQTDYARAYEQLIEVARTNTIRLVLSTFSMAVNQRSESKLVDFYRGTHVAVYWQIKANAMHSEIVRHLASEHPEVCLVDTQPGLDGQHDQFTDLVHLTQDGRQQLAETFFASIRPILENELATGPAERRSTR